MTAINLVMGMGFMHGVETVSRLVANSFVSGLWQGIVLAAGVGLCLRLVPKATAAVRFAIWTAVFAVLAVLPLLHAYTLRSGGGMPGHGAVVQLDVRWSFAIAALWLIVSLVRAVKLAMSAVRLHRPHQRSKQPQRRNRKAPAHIHMHHRPAPSHPAATTQRISRNQRQRR